MSGRGWLSWVRSNDKLIIEALQNQGANFVCQATEMLVELITNYSDVETKRAKIKDFEHRGDVIAHKLFNIIDETFVTPFDREDISRIASSIDEILDYTDGTARQVGIFQNSETNDTDVRTCQYIAFCVSRSSFFDDKIAET